VRWFGAGIIGKWFAQYRRRGTTVPFESPALRMAKVCDDERDGMIAVLHDFANNGSTYIVPWSSLPLMASMTTHDAALHKAIGESKATAPAQVRAVVSRLALSGALGPEAKARETERAKAGETRLSEVELVLILHLLDSCGANLASLMANPDCWHDADAKAALTAAAAAMAVKRQQIYLSIAEFAKLLTPVGLVAAEGTIQPGWLRVLHDEIEWFGRNVAVIDQPASANISEYLAAIAESAARTAQLTGVVLSMIDYAVLDIGGTIRRWDAELRPLGRTIDRLSVMLDEWPALMQWVRDAQHGPPDELLGQLRALHCVLPHLPRPDPSGAERASDKHQGAPSVTRVLGARLSTIRSLLHSPRSVVP
jgi:hypothetical protein